MFFSLVVVETLAVVVLVLGSACQWIYRASVMLKRALLCRRLSCEPLRRAAGCIASVLQPLAGQFFWASISCVKRRSTPRATTRDRAGGLETLV